MHLYFPPYTILGTTFHMIEVFDKSEKSKTDRQTSGRTETKYWVTNRQIFLCATVLSDTINIEKGNNFFLGQRPGHWKAIWFYRGQLWLQRSIKSMVSSFDKITHQRSLIRFISNRPIWFRLRHKNVDLTQMSYLIKFLKKTIIWSLYGVSFYR